MLLNYPASDLKKKIKSQKIKLGEIAERMGISQPNLSAKLCDNSVNLAFIRIAETAGYDCRLVLIPKGTEIPDEPPMTEAERHREGERIYNELIAHFGG